MSYRLSMVVAAYNEEELLEDFIRKSMRDLAKVSDDFEIVLVNDGSTDTTLDIARRLAEEFPELKLINLEKKAAIKLSEKIRAEGTTEAEKLKAEVRGRKPEAIKYIIKVISGA